MACRKEEEVHLVVLTPHEWDRMNLTQSLFTIEIKDHLQYLKANVWCFYLIMYLINNEWLKQIYFLQLQNWLIVSTLFAVNHINHLTLWPFFHSLIFFLEFSTFDRAYCHSKWPQLDSYACTTATVWILESCTHSNPGCPEGAVGRQIRVPALLYRILRGTWERVAVPIPLLP